MKTDEFIDIIEDEDNSNQGAFKLATVVSLFQNGTAKIQFDGEETPSDKEYAYLDSYLPESGDRVVLGAISGTYIILGRVRYAEADDPEPDIDRYLFDLKQVLMKKGLVVDGGATIDSLTVKNTFTSERDIVANGNLKGNTITSSGGITGESLNVSGKSDLKDVDVSYLYSSGDIRASSTVRGNTGSFGTMNSTHSKINNLTVDNPTFNYTTRCGDSLTVSGGITANSTFKHNGSQLGFFGASTSGRHRFSTDYSDLNGVTNTLRSLINALKAYGLIV